MTDADAFLRAICEDPADDTRRLVYADWLEERGDPRAEFIRVQCELAKHWLTEATKNDPEHWCGNEQMQDLKEWHELRRRERELLANMINWNWFACKPWHTDGMQVYPQDASVRTGIGNEAIVGFIRRGFVSEVHCRLADWGSKCRKCGGSGRHSGLMTLRAGGYTLDTCADCHGTGRLPGHGPRIVLSAPIEKLVITPAFQRAGIMEWEEDCLKLLNDARTAAGLPTLAARNAIVCR